VLVCSLLFCTLSFWVFAISWGEWTPLDVRRSVVMLTSGVLLLTVSIGLLGRRSWARVLGIVVFSALAVFVGVENTNIFLSSLSGIQDNQCLPIMMASLKLVMASVLVAALVLVAWFLYRKKVADEFSRPRFSTRLDE
jgi:hypothetical protein